jgi:predicted aminopeptidase
MASIISATDLLLPIVRDLRHRADASVIESRILCDNDLDRYEGCVRLLVTHELLRWPLYYDKVTNHLPLLVERMKKAMLVREPEAKSIALNRRRMLWRGSEARKTKPIRKD